MRKLNDTNQSNFANDLRNKIFLILFSLLLSLLIIDGFLRLINYFPKTTENMSYYFITKPSLKDQRTAYAYHENTEVREVAVTEGRKGLYIEFDASFKTNNLGLVQRSTVISGRKSIVIIGDSFTQGIGADPWFYRLEESWYNNDYQLVNLGITGTGMLHWQDTIQWFSKIGEIRHIFMVFISDDWFRARWYAQEDLESTGLFFWDTDRGNLDYYESGIPPDVSFIEKNTSHSVILKKVQIISSNYWLLRIKVFFKNIQFLRILNDIRKKYILDKIFDQSINTFDQIVSDYGNKNITMIHIPYREEVSSKSYDEYGKRVRNFILSRHVSYIDGLALCGFTKDDFNNSDPHPNKTGYAKLMNCLLTYGLKNLKLD